MPSLNVDFETFEALQRYRLRLATEAGSAVGISMNSAVHHLLISNPPYPGRAEPDALTYNNLMPAETIEGAPAQFVYQQCSLGSQYSSSAKDLYAEFQEWCKETGTYCPSQRGFGMQLTAMGLQRKRRNGGTHWWEGIRISGVSESGHPKQQLEKRRPLPPVVEDGTIHHEEPSASNLGHRTLGEDVDKFGLSFKTVVGRPESKDEAIQRLLDGIFSGALDRGIDLQLSRDGSGRWLSFPDNFMSIRLQPRNKALLVTAYGDPKSFNDLTGHALQVKVDRKPYSRFHVRSTADLSPALDIIAASQALRAEKMFGSAVEFDPMKEIDVKSLEQSCSLLMVPTGLGTTSLIGQQIRSLGADRCLIVTSSNAAAEGMQAQLFRRFALPFKVLDRTSLAEGANPVPYRDGKWLFLTTHDVFKRLLSNRGCERLLPTREGPLWDLVAIEEIQPLVSSESLDFDEFTNGESWWERETTLRSPTFTNHLVILTTPHVLQRTEELDSISNLFDQRWSYSGGSRLMSESTAREVWRAVLGDLQLQLPRPTFETWLKPTEGVAYDDHVFEVEAPNPFAMEWLERRMYHALQKTLHKVSGREFELRLTVKPQRDFYAVEQSFPVPDQAVSATPAAPPLFEMRSFNPKYSFDTFVAGPSNQLALSASLAVAESPGQTYNPLFLHSGAGLGKTHLLQAIGKTCASRGMSVLYVTSEQFTNEFITAIRNRTTEDFRRRYRSVQVLLMDDLQFLSGKEQTHEGFFHTFNDLHNSGNQVVISSDRPPRELGSIEDRLRSRFEWGLIADIQPPDLETRMAILANKAGQMRIDLADSVIELIAKRVQRNVRELEGSLNRMVAYSQLMNVNINLESTLQILNEMAPETADRSIDPQRIFEQVAVFYALSVRDLMSKNRTKKVALARQIAMYLLIYELELSPTQVGRLLGGRDHSTVIHGAGKINGEVAENGQIRQDILAIKESIFA